MVNFSFYVKEKFEKGFKSFCFLGDVFEKFIRI